MELHAPFLAIHRKKLGPGFNLFLSTIKRRTFLSFKITVYSDFFKSLFPYEIVAHNDGFEFCYVIFVHDIQNIEATFRL